MKVNLVNKIRETVYVNRLQKQERNKEGNQFFIDGYIFITLLKNFKEKILFV